MELKKKFRFIILDYILILWTKENNKELVGLEDRYLKLLLPIIIF